MSRTLIKFYLSDLLNFCFTLQLTEHHDWAMHREYEIRDLLDELEGDE